MLYLIGALCYHNLTHQHHNFIVQRDMVKIQHKVYTAALGILEQDFDLGFTLEFDLGTSCEVRIINH
jgi:hypothetical protein